MRVKYFSELDNYIPFPAYNPQYTFDFPSALRRCLKSFQPGNSTSGAKTTINFHLRRRGFLLCAASFCSLTPRRMVALCSKLAPDLFIFITRSRGNNFCSFYGHAWSSKHYIIVPMPIYWPAIH
jgi:hypothetical protein